MSEPEICSDCGQPKPIVQVLRSEEGDRLQCRICANRWLLSDEEWPPQTQQTKDKTPIQTNSKSSV